MRAKTSTDGFTGPKTRAHKDSQVRRALLRAMKGALSRSVVLLPLSEDEDQLQEYFQNVFGFTA